MNKEKNITVDSDGFSWWKETSETICDRLDTCLKNGLDQNEAETRLESHGPNALPKQKTVSALSVLIEQFSSLIIWILIAAAAIAGFLGEWIDAVAIIAIVILNGILGFVQEYRSIRTMEALIKLSNPTSKVVRNGELKNIPSENIVPGDLILLEAGDKVPADGRLIKESLLNIQEAALTGESASVAKQIDPIDDPDLPLGDRKNMVYRGTTVVSGKGYFIATGTGLDTELGKIAKLLDSIENKQTPLQKRLDRLGKRLVYLCLIIVALIFVLGQLRGYSMLDMLMTSLSLAVAAIPEGLPAVVTIALAIGMQKMARRNALIRKLSAVETLGCTTIICTDKTGTLTENKMRVHTLWANHQMISMTGEGYVPKGKFEKDGRNVDPSEEKELYKLLEIVSLCNNTNLTEEKGKWDITGSPTEGALIVAARTAGVLPSRDDILDEVPFDSERKRMSVLVDGKLYLKGAPDILLERSDFVYLDGEDKHLSPEMKQELKNAIRQLASNGLRVLGAAYRLVENADKIESNMEKNLVFVGLAAMRDPPRKEAKESIKKCLQAGIKPVMVTGDHIETAVAIAKELDILQDGEAIDGKKLEKMNREELQHNIEKISVYSRVTAKHKMSIIETL